MTRPETIDDLTPDQRRGPEFASFDLGAFPVGGVNLLGIAGEFLDACTRMARPVEIVRTFGRINCHATPSEEQLDVVLAQQQSGWNYMNDKYKAALDGAAPNDSDVWLIKQWCTREGLNLPWEAVPE